VTQPQRRAGLLVVVGAIVCFSISSTLIKKAGAPGPTLAFWRMVLASIIWTAVLRVTEHRFVTRAELKLAILPGIAFGLNITCFFTGVTHTSVANAEFIGALTPLILVPAGAIIFAEHLHPQSLLFGLVSLAGLALVLFFGPPNGEATWIGNGIIFVAMLLWSFYLVTSRTMRISMSVVSIMASVMPIAALTILPLVVANGEIGEVTAHSALYILLLALLTGTLAHGFIVFAQRAVPVGTISIMQVGQPALAVMWTLLLLGRTVRPVQVLGMAMVLGGLLLVTVQTQRNRA
jgi:drug/metabolite transporter (DMT)-like permease